jgi:hypothetical protein
MENVCQEGLNDGTWYAEGAKDGMVTWDEDVCTCLLTCSFGGNSRSEMIAHLLLLSFFNPLQSHSIHKSSHIFTKA